MWTVEPINKSLCGRQLDVTALGDQRATAVRGANGTWLAKVYCACVKLRIAAIPPASLWTVNQSPQLGKLQEHALFFRTSAGNMLESVEDADARLTRSSAASTLVSSKLYPTLSTI